MKYLGVEEWSCIYFVFMHDCNLAAHLWTEQVFLFTRTSFTVQCLFINVIYCKTQTLLYIVIIMTCIYFIQRTQD